VAFNYRYSPRNSALRQIIRSGAIGTVTSVHFEWLLDISHGADYFRRWHRSKSNSGGLQIHKAAHHFDLMNWWLDDVPSRVFASGGLRFYGSANAALRGIQGRPDRGTHDGDRDPFDLDLRRDERLKQLYLDNESHDGYRRDLDVFSDGITIEDNLAVVVDYLGGATLSYSLNAHSPWEGYRVAVNGTEGRAELDVAERVAVIPDEIGHVPFDLAEVEDGALGGDRVPGERLLLQRHWEIARQIDIPTGLGAHGGGDAMLLADVFNRTSEDPLMRRADYLDGLRSVAVGIAANQSMATGSPRSIDDLGLGVDLRHVPASV
jgi:predicted dehydrogenase